MDVAHLCIKFFAKSNQKPDALNNCFGGFERRMVLCRGWLSEMTMQSRTVIVPKISGLLCDSSSERATAIDDYVLHGKIAGMIR